MQTVGAAQLIDVGGGTGRAFGFTFQVPAGYVSGFKRARDGQSPETFVSDGLNFLFTGAGVIRSATFITGLTYPGNTLNVLFTVQSPQTGEAIDADVLPTAQLLKNGVVDAGVTVAVARVGLGKYSTTFTIPGGYAVGTSLGLLVNALVGGVTANGVIFQGTLGAVPIPDTSALTWSQRRAFGDICDVVRLSTDYDNELENFTVLKRLVPYFHVPTRNLEQFTYLGRQIEENIDTTDHGLFGEDEVIPSDAYLVNRSGPNPRTGKPNRLNGLFFRVLGPAQFMPATSAGRNDEAIYELRYDEQPHPDLKTVTGD